jgi:hypothetical protein
MLTSRARAMRCKLPMLAVRRRPTRGNRSAAKDQTPAAAASGGMGGAIRRVK